MSDPRVVGAFRPEVVADAIRQPDFATLTVRARRRRHRRLAASVASFVAVVAAVVAVPTLIDRSDSSGGIDVGAGPYGSATDFEARAAAIADGWQRGGMAYSAGLGFVPLDELTRLTAESPEKPGTFGVEDTFATEAQYQAFLHGRFTLSSTLPTTIPPPGTISLSGDESISTPLASARAAYIAMDRADATPGCDCIELTVTAATLGTVRMPTTRGDATVPAWIFTVDDLRAPVARVAVASSATAADVLRRPIEMIAEPQAFFHSVESYTAQGQGLTLDFVGGQCDASRTGQVYETADTVVLGVAIATSGEFCDAIGILSTVDVHLAEPVGDRVVLAVSSGLPVPEGR